MFDFIFGGAEIIFRDEELIFTCLVLLNRINFGFKIDST